MPFSQTFKPSLTKEVHTIGFLLESGKILRTTFIIKWPLKARLNSTLTESSLKEGQKMHTFYYKRTNKSLREKITYCKIGKDFLTFLSCKQKRLIIANIISSNLKRIFDFFSLQKKGEIIAIQPIKKSLNLMVYINYGLFL